MEKLLLVIVCIFFTIAFVICTIQFVEHARIIKMEVRRLGGKNVLVSEKLFYINRYSRTYSVSFMDENGKAYHTTCQIRHFGKLYWTQSPDVILGDFSTDIVPISSKEKLINSLTSAFMYERKYAIANAAQMEQVDESIIHLLQEIAHSDPHKIIRTAATEALQSLNRL
jgi:hypothetical protein